MEAFLADQCALVGLYTHPDALPDRITPICDIYQFFGAVDNVLDNVDIADRGTPAIRAVVQQLLDSMRTGAGAAGDSLYAKEVTELVCRFHAHMSVAQRQRLQEALAEYVHGCAVEDPLRTGNSDLDFATFIGIHLKSGTRALVQLMVEFGLGIDMTAPLAACPALQAAADASVKHCLLTNDLFSYRKEHFHGDATMNALTVFLRDGCHTLQQAVDRLCEQVHTAEEEFYTAQGEVLDSAVGQCPDVRAYLHGLEMFSAGFVCYGFTCGRYNGPGHRWNGVESGLMVLHPDRTEYR
nr:terpene synthase family protein [Streptomyces sp. YIM 121038]